jgi:hypothetical protein
VSPTSTADHYRVLGVPRDASQEEIARAFRALAKRLHPDRDGGEAVRFREVRAAFEVLGNPARRHAYDATRAEPPVVRPRVERRPPPPRWTPARARLALVGGILLLVAGVGAALAVVLLRVDAADARRHTLPATATVVRSHGETRISFTTAAGEPVLVAAPRRQSGAGRAATMPIRYDPANPTDVRADESTLARDITIAIVALKLLVGGAVLTVLGARKLRVPVPETETVTPARRYSQGSPGAPVRAVR